MQIKVGVDVIEVERIRQSIEDLGEDFAHRVFTDKEIKYCDSKKVGKLGLVYKLLNPVQLQKYK